MASILHILDADHVRDAREGRRFIDEQRLLPPLPNVRFAAFVADICARYPDLSDTDLDGDDDANLWEEGLGPEASYGSVKELVLKHHLMDEAVVDALVEVAMRHGLQVFDDEGGRLYPMDGPSEAGDRIPADGAGPRLPARPPMQGEAGLMRFDGVYQGPREGGRRGYYRFWPDGCVYQTYLDDSNPQRAAWLLRPGGRRVAAGRYETKGAEFRGETALDGVVFRIGGRLRVDGLLLYRTRADGEEPFSAEFGFVPVDE